MSHEIRSPLNAVIGLSENDYIASSVPLDAREGGKWGKGFLGGKVAIGGLVTRVHIGNTMSS